MSVFVFVFSIVILLLFLLLLYINLQHSALVTTFSSVARSNAEQEQRPANISFDFQFQSISEKPKREQLFKNKKIPSYGCTSTKIATTPPTCRRNLVTRLSQNDVSSRVAHDAVASDHLVGRADDVHLWFGNMPSIFGLGLVFIFHLSSQFLN